MNEGHDHGNVLIKLDEMKLSKSSTKALLEDIIWVLRNYKKMGNLAILAHSNIVKALVPIDNFFFESFARTAAWDPRRPTYLDSAIFYKDQSVFRKNERVYQVRNLREFKFQTLYRIFRSILVVGLRMQWAHRADPCRPNKVKDQHCVSRVRCPMLHGTDRTTGASVA